MFGERERPLMPAQFALRVAILGGFALVMFSIIFFRLWYLQVLSGRQVPEAGQEQPGPRGHRAGAARRDPRPQRQRPGRQPHRAGAPGPARPSCRGSHRRRERGVRTASARSIGMSPKAIQQAASTSRRRSCPANPVTLKRDVGYDLVYYLRENQDRFPGVSVERVYVRNYPDGTLARPAPRLRPRGHRPAAQGARATRACSRATRSASRGSRTPTTTSCAGSTGRRGSRSTPRASPTGGRAQRRRSRKPGDNLLLTHRRRRCRRRARRRSTRSASRAPSWR